VQTLATTMLTIGLQLALGTLVFAVAAAFSANDARRMSHTLRRRAAVRARAAAEMMRSLPVAVVLGLAGAGLRVALGTDPRDLLTGSGGIWLLVVGAIPTSAGYLLHDSARLEAAGKLRISRRQVRFGGRWMFWGVVALLAWAGVDLLLRPGYRNALLDGPPLAAPVLAAGALALAVSAFIGLLAGLSGKPRPSGEYAVLLYLCGLAGMLGALGSL